jgi:membrane-bound metal-dependent hydrolase YbcI (DUF457 family)
MEFLRLFSEINLCWPSFIPRKVKYDDVLLFKHSYIYVQLSILFLNDEVQTNLYLYFRNNDIHISPYVGGHRMVLHSLFQNMYSL